MMVVCIFISKKMDQGFGNKKLGREGEILDAEFSKVYRVGRSIFSG
jgi:hypothetical protein